MVPVVQRIEIDWTEEDTDKRYQLGVMLDSCSDFGLGRKKGAAQLQRQFDRWSQQHPEYQGGRQAGLSDVPGLDQRLGHLLLLPLTPATP